MTTLEDIKTGSRCIIAKVHGHGGFRHRILELGFVRGETVTVIKNAPLLDPVEYEVMGSHVSLRRSEARMIEVVSLEAAAHPDRGDFRGTIEEHVRHEVQELEHEITVALVGNPNCGKTSFFNHATGLREKVGNYSGVTVDAKVGIFHHRGYTINLVDLPGTYSLTEFTPEELYVRSFLTKEHPDLVLNIVDAGNLERNLFLTTQLIDMNPHMVMALNMYDEVEKKGDTIDIAALSRMLGFPIVPTVGSTGRGIPKVLEALVRAYEEANSQEDPLHPHAHKHIHINYGENVEASIHAVRALLDQNPEVHNLYHSRYIALKLIENDSVTHEEMSHLPNYAAIQAEAQRQQKMLETEYKEDIQTILSDLKYGFVRGALSETVHRNEEKKSLGYALDIVLTNRWLGFPVLILFLFLMFAATFLIGAYPQDWLEAGVEWLNRWVTQVMPAGMLRDLLTDGVISGVGGVLVFLPNILILFFFISLLEDTGYMARAAFLMDKLMHRIGLHGKSFIPYIIGFGCGVPAVMATRTLENRKDRILTILTIPFMSCSARLPLYLLLTAACFPRQWGPVILLAMYLLGILVAICTSLLLKRLCFRDDNDQFVMELPPYRFPTVRNTLIHMWDKSAQYLQKMGTVILAASIIIWALGYFPHQDTTGMSPEAAAQYQMANSYIGQLGQAVAPLFKPLGFDWKMGISLVTGLAAKEVVVSSLSVFYGNTMPFTPVSAFAFMLFILLYFPCIATIAAIRREAGRKWMWFTIFYTTGLAWVVAFLFTLMAQLL